MARYQIRKIQVCEMWHQSTSANTVKGFPAASYSHAVKADGLVYVAGQTGMDFGTGKISDNFEIQARQAFENLVAVLRAAGSELELVVKTTECRKL